MESKTNIVTKEQTKNCAQIRYPCSHTDDNFVASLIVIVYLHALMGMTP